jgi:hypothetical protein
LMGRVSKGPNNITLHSFAWKLLKAKNLESYLMKRNIWCGGAERLTPVKIDAKCLLKMSNIKIYYLYPKIKELI